MDINCSFMEGMPMLGKVSASWKKGKVFVVKIIAKVRFHLSRRTVA